MLNEDYDGGRCQTCGASAMPGDYDDAITVKDAEIERLRAAIQPFADFIRGAGEKLPDNMQLTNGSSMARRQVTAADFKAALAAISEKRTEGK